jgi:F/Y rich C-terminus
LILTIIHSPPLPTASSKFQVEADDNRGTVFEGRTPTTVWTEVVRKAFSIRNLDYQHSPVGPEFFGLRKNAIAKMIQDLPNAKKCRKYVWQTFRATMSGKAGRNRRRINNLGTLSPELSEQQQQPPTVINLDKPFHNH